MAKTRKRSRRSRSRSRARRTGPQFRKRSMHLQEETALMMDDISKRTGWAGNRSLNVLAQAGFNAIRGNRHGVTDIAKAIHAQHKLHQTKQGAARRIAKVEKEVSKTVA